MVSAILPYVLACVAYNATLSRGVWLTYRRPAGVEGARRGIDWIWAALVVSLLTAASYVVAGALGGQSWLSAVVGGLIWLFCAGVNLASLRLMHRTLWLRAEIQRIEAAQ